MNQSPDALARAWFDEVWNNRDESAIDRLMQPDVLAHGLGPEPFRGPGAFKPFYHALKGALDIKVEVVRTIVQGDMCVAHCHVTGKHVGPTLGGPATHKNVDFWGMTLLHVKDGKIAEGWNTFDFLTMYQQVGWVANPVLPA